MIINTFDSDYHIELYANIIGTLSKILSKQISEFKPQIDTLTKYTQFNMGQSNALSCMQKNILPASVLQKLLLQVNVHTQLAGQLRALN